MALIEIEDVVAGYGIGPDILTGISLRIEADKSYCIIGPNGAGKSTLLKAICGLRRDPRAGASPSTGLRLTGLRTDEILRRGICFVPQDRSLFPDMTVTENLRMGGYILKDRHAVEERIEEVLEMFPILRERRSQLRQDACPAASSSSSCSAGRWCSVHASSCSTSRRSASRRSSRARSSTP